MVVTSCLLVVANLILTEVVLGLQVELWPFIGTVLLTDWTMTSYQQGAINLRLKSFITLPQLWVGLFFIFFLEIPMLSSTSLATIAHSTLILRPAQKSIDRKTLSLPYTLISKMIQQERSPALKVHGLFHLKSKVLKYQTGHTLEKTFMNETTSFAKEHGFLTVKGYLFSCQDDLRKSEMEAKKFNTQLSSKAQTILVRINNEFDKQSWFKKVI